MDDLKRIPEGTWVKGWTVKGYGKFAKHRYVTGYVVESTPYGCKFVDVDGDEFYKRNDSLKVLEFERDEEMVKGLIDMTLVLGKGQDGPYKEWFMELCKGETV